MPSSRWAVDTETPRRSAASVTRIGPSCCSRVASSSAESTEPIAYAGCSSQQKTLSLVRNGRTVSSTRPHGQGSSMQFYLDGYRPGDPLIAQPHPSVAERPDGLPEEVDVLIVGCGPGGPGAGRAARPVPRDPDGDRRPAGRSARGGPGRRRRLPHRGDVRGLRARRPAGRRGLLGQRGRLLAARPRGPLPDHPHRTHPGRRGRPVGVPARDRQPGPDAGLPARAHGALGRPGWSPTTACTPPTCSSTPERRRAR